MTAVRYSACIIGAMLISACGTPESTASLGGVSPQQAGEIGRLVRAQTSAKIISYTRDIDGAIDVQTSDDYVYVARLVAGKWQIERMGLID